MHPQPRQRLEDARLYLLCEELDEARVEAALRGGVDLVELLERDDDDRLLQAAARLRPICDRHGALLMLNNRPDLVAAADADGVHIERPDIDLERARAQIGPDRLLGLSTRSPAEIDAARDAPLDYISVGPVHATPLRPQAAPVGPALLTYASRHCALPFFAVGGIEPHNAGAVAAAGAQRIAVSRAITRSADPQRAAAVLRAEITSPADFLERYRARTEAQNAAARARLEPLGPDERPGALRLAVAVAAAAALVNLVGYLAGVRLHGSRLSPSELVPFVVVMGILAAGMWRRSGAAVLLFMALLAIIVVLFSLFLIEASNLLGVVVPLLFIGAGGLLFWKLVRVLGRIQAPRH
ncbi:MAG TPA: thiamine phosphate synthase [Solirubrobacteraceae bacterium]|nr:thiamine phosphate synthase [Solirubrobacteraceae bacterium]